MFGLWKDVTKGSLLVTLWWNKHNRLWVVTFHPYHMILEAFEGVRTWARRRHVTMWVIGLDLLSLVTLNGAVARALSFLITTLLLRVTDTCALSSGDASAYIAIPMLSVIDMQFWRAMSGSKKCQCHPLIRRSRRCISNRLYPTGSVGCAYGWIQDVFSETP